MNAEPLLEDRPWDRARRLSRRELMAEAAVGGAFVAAAVSMAIGLPPAAWPSVTLTGGLIVAYALASWIKFEVGVGFTAPTQLVLVPMLFLLPAAAVPLAVAAALGLSALVELLHRRAHPERALVALGNAWFSVGPALVLSMAGEPDPAWSDWQLYLAAMGAQFAVDLTASTVREWLGQGIAPSMHLKALGWVYLVDALLAPVGLVAAGASVSPPYAVALVAPLSALLAFLARERSRHIARAVELSRDYRGVAVALQRRVEELDHERCRVQQAVQRIGETFASNLDREALLEIVTRTAVDASSASCGRAIFAEERATRVDEPTDPDDARRLDEALAAAEELARCGHRGRAETEGAFAIAAPLAARLADPAAVPGVISVARSGRPFSAREHDLLGHLAAQASVAVENVALHEQLQHRAETDHLTGLSNRGRLEDFLATEIERARRYQVPLALLMLDIDDFKQVNDTQGHQSGDLVLREVARIVRATCREIDEPARYGGEELAVALPQTDVDGAYRVAERIRSAVESLDMGDAVGAIRSVTVSAGVAALDRGVGDKASLIARADAALYAAKRSGKNRTVRSDDLRPRPERPEAMSRT